MSKRYFDRDGVYDSVIDDYASTSAIVYHLNRIADLEAKLAESENKLNQYPYKNDVIEKQYEDLKDAITFLMLNNIKDQEQLNYSIDVLCEKHKARIRDIENGICRIEQLEQQLAEKEKELKAKETLNQIFKDNREAKISFAVEQLRQVKKLCKEKFDWWENSEWEGNVYDKFDVSNAYFDIEANIDEQIAQLTHQHEDRGETK